jgi:hemin uptake protein HemP
MDMLTAKFPPRMADTSPVSTDVQPRGPNIPCVNSDSLFGRSREILIEHSGCFYRLRVTHSNKLILTK